MRRRILLTIGLLSLSGCIFGKPSVPPRDVSEVDERQVKLMIERFGPMLYLRDDEAYLLDDPEFVLDRGTKLAWGAVENEHDFNTFRLDKVQTTATSSRTLRDDTLAARVRIQSEPDVDKYRVWLQLDDAYKHGDLRRAKVLVHVLPVGSNQTELQFWFYYPFNGPGRVRIRLSAKIGSDVWLKETGRHYSDWELVSVLVSNTATELHSVYISRHSGGEIFNRSEDGVLRSVDDRARTLEVEGPQMFEDMYIAHPIVYAGISSHAHYPSAGNHFYKRVASQNYLVGQFSVDLFDRTDAGRAFKAYDVASYRIVSSDLPAFKVVEPAWLEYDGRWGQYEKLRDVVPFALGPRGAVIGIPTGKQGDYREIGAGPSGPKGKPEWKGAVH